LNSRLKSILSASLATLMLLSMLMVFPTAFAVDGTQLAILDAVDGDNLLHYTNNDPPPDAAGYPLGYVLANVSYYNAHDTNLSDYLANYQLNITWDPALLSLKAEDFIIPSDNVFGANAEIAAGPDNSTPGQLFVGVGIKLAGPEYVNVTEWGTLCQLKFNVTKIPTIAENLTCLIHLVTSGEYPIYSFAGDVEGGEIVATLVDCTYEYLYEPPALPKPRLVVSPALTELGKPAGPPITGTPDAFFQVDVVMDDSSAARIVNESMLTAIQFAFKYKTDLFRLVNASGLPPPPDVNNATEGNFMNKIAWAPYGTDFWTAWGGMEDDKEVQYVLIIINPNDTTGNWDWGVFPESTGLPVSERVICTFYFEATVQEESPWNEYVVGAFDIDYIFPDLPERMFLNAEDEWIGAKAPVDGDYAIYGWVLGLMIDVYTQYPDDHNGKGLNETSDMFYPQGDVHLFAKLTYNGDPVQNKPVTFQVWNEQGYINFTKTALTDENGVAHIYFGIEWPCEGGEDLIFGKWTVVASAWVRERFAWDWMWFKVYWLVYDFKVTSDPTVKKTATEPYPVLHINITFVTFKEIPVKVLIHVVVMDNLQVPIGKASIWILVGDETLVFCENKSDYVELEVPIPKWAFVGESTIEVSALSNWPSEGGYAYCPEATTTFTIEKYST